MQPAREGIPTRIETRIYSTSVYRVQGKKNTLSHAFSARNVHFPLTPLQERERSPITGTCEGCRSHELEVSRYYPMI